MSVTQYRVVNVNDVESLLGDGWQPYGAPMYSREGLLVQAVVQGTPVGDATIVADLSTIQTQLGAIETWSAALAAKLNADDGVDDADYVGVSYA